MPKMPKPNPLNICDRGLRVGRCVSAQTTIKKLGGKPFTCEDCRFEEVVPKLIRDHIDQPASGIVDMLLAFGMREEADEFLNQTVTDKPQAVASCSYTQVRIARQCGDKRCPLWIPADWALNCVNQFRAAADLDSMLSARQLATAFASNPKAIEELLTNLRKKAQEELLKDVVPAGAFNKKHPDWVRDLERKFSRPIESVLEVLPADVLAGSYSLSDEQAAYLADIRVAE